LQPPVGPDKNVLKALIETGKQALKAGQLAEGETALQEGLALLTNQARPDLEGRILNLLGRAFDKHHQPEKALSYYQRAAERFELAGLPEKQAQALYAVASLHDEQGQ